jgi:hypothetical protein
VHPGYRGCGGFFGPTISADSPRTRGTGGVEDFLDRPFLRTWGTGGVEDFLDRPFLRTRGTGGVEDFLDQPFLCHGPSRRSVRHGGFFGPTVSPYPGYGGCGGFFGPHLPSWSKFQKS